MRASLKNWRWIGASARPENAAVAPLRTRPGGLFGSRRRGWASRICGSRLYAIVGDFSYNYKEYNALRRNAANPCLFSTANSRWFFRMPHDFRFRVVRMEIHVQITLLLLGPCLSPYCLKGLQA